MIDAVMDLEAIRKAIGFQSWTLAGHSTGGMIGLQYGIHFPESLDSLPLVGTAGRYYGAAKTCIYNSNYLQFQSMQDVIDELKDSGLFKEKRSILSKERTKLSIYLPDKYFTKAPKNRCQLSA